MVTGSRRPFTLFGQTRQAVLAALMLRPDEKLHLRQVARVAGTGLGAVQRELKTLVDGGVLCRERSGNQVYFRANTGSAIYPELRGLLAKTAGLVDVLRAALAPVAADVRLAIVFGSMASARNHSESDVDLLVIADGLTFRDLGGPVRAAGQQLDREVNVNLYRPAEWAKRVAAGHPLSRAILMEPKLFVIGDQHGLDRLAEERVDSAKHARPGSHPSPAAGD